MPTNNDALTKPLTTGPDPLIVKIDRVTNWLMAIIVIVPLFISFGALKALASVNAVSYPFLYPVMVDGGLLIFKALALRESLRGRRDWFTWSMAIALTAVSVALNVVHVPDTIASLDLARLMAALPPIVIIMAFVAVSRRIEQTAQRDKAVISLADIMARMAEKRAEFAKLTDKLTADFDKLQAAKMAEIDKLASELDSLAAEKLSLKADIRQLRQERKTAVSATAVATDTAVSDSGSDNDHDNELTDRQRQILDLLKAGHDKADIAGMLQVSERTVYRDISQMNGVVASMGV